MSPNFARRPVEIANAQTDRVISPRLLRAQLDTRTSTWVCSLETRRQRQIVAPGKKDFPMHRSLHFISLIGLMLVASTAAAREIYIQPHCRVKNRPPGRCGWCALETLARQHGLKAIYG